MLQLGRPSADICSVNTPPPSQPGFGAEEIASRASLRLAKLRREQEMGMATDAAVQKQIDQAVRRQQNYSQGAEGERLVAQTLGFVERYGWTSLHDVHWPGRPHANIDHIAVGPGGVVVIDAKNWTGEVKITAGTLRQNGYSRAKETSAASDAAAAVAALLAPPHRMAALAVLCLVAQDVETTRIETTDVVGRSTLTDYLVHLPQRLSAYDVADIARYLHGELANSKSPDLITTAFLERPAKAGRPASPRGPHQARPARRATQPGTRAVAPRNPARSAFRFGWNLLRKLVSLVLGLMLIAMVAGVGLAVLNIVTGGFVDRMTTQSP